jgi:hypothetical protein
MIAGKEREIKRYGDKFGDLERMMDSDGSRKKSNDAERNIANLKEIRITNIYFISYPLRYQIKLKRGIISSYAKSGTRKN